MAWLNLTVVRERYVLAAACWLLALGCGDELRAAPSDGRETDERVDGGRAVKRDAGAGDKGGDRGGARPSDASGGSAVDVQLTAVEIDHCGRDNPAGLDPAQVAALKGQGTRSGMRFLYPYAGTVFPRGLAAPLLMWEGPAANAVLVRIRSEFFAYDGCLKLQGNGRVQLPKEVWEAAGAQTLGARTPFELSLSTLGDGVVTGPIGESITIARARVQGSIYYNSYNSGALGVVSDTLTAGPSALDLPGSGIDPASSLSAGGSISRIRPGSERPETFLRVGVCTGCHSVSANGERMIAKEIASANDGSIYALTPTTRPNPAPTRAGIGTAFVGLSPDGSVYLSTAAMAGLGPSTLGALGAVPSLSMLFETDTGRLVENSGIPDNAMMPTFSPGGSLLTFADFAPSLGGTRVALMRYDEKARAASDLRVLFESPEGSYAGWPFVLPDDRAVIFTLGESPSFSGGGAGIVPILRGPRSDLMVADADTGASVMLAKAMGFATPEDAAMERTYLPFGAEETHQSYYPTVSPVASGGYFWVFFDSVRHYGNLGKRRQLWGTAVTIQRSSETSSGGYTIDPSAPAFYVTGQQLQTANHRAFTALDPCRAEGDRCESGVDCCSGFCTDGVCSPPRACADSGEACDSDASCCTEGSQCIAGFCGSSVI